MRLVVIACLLPVLAHAQPAPDESARALSTEGTAAYEAGKYPEAAARFEAAYALHPDPAYLFNLGQAYRGGEQCSKAGAVFRKYLDAAPDAANGDQVRGYIKEMTSCVLFAEGRALLGRAQPADACAKFAAALEEDPSAIGTLTNLGLCHEQLGKFATARAWYRKALDLARTMKLADAEQAVKKHHDALEASVSLLTIAAPDGAKVVLDGKPVLGALERIEVDPGDHVIEIDATRREITVRRGRHLEVGPPRDTRARDRRRIKQLGLVGGGLVATSLALGFVARYRYQTTNDRGELRAWKSIVRYGGTTMFVAGAAAITGAIVIYVRRPDDERPVVAPIVTDEQVGVGLSGTF